MISGRCRSHPTRCTVLHRHGRQDAPRRGAVPPLPEGARSRRDGDRIRLALGQGEAAEEAADVPDVRVRKILGITVKLKKVSFPWERSS